MQTWLPQRCALAAKSVRQCRRNGPSKRCIASTPPASARLQPLTSLRRAGTAWTGGPWLAWSELSALGHPVAHMMETPGRRRASARTHAPSWQPGGLAGSLQISAGSFEAGATHSWQQLTSAYETLDYTHANVVQHVAVRSKCRRAWYGWCAGTQGLHRCTHGTRCLTISYAPWRSCNSITSQHHAHLFKSCVCASVATLRSVVRASRVASDRFCASCASCLFRRAFEVTVCTSDPCLRFLHEAGQGLRQRFLAAAPGRGMLGNPTPTAALLHTQGMVKHRWL